MFHFGHLDRILSPRMIINHMFIRRILQHQESLINSTYRKCSLWSFRSYLTSKGDNKTYISLSCLSRPFKIHCFHHLRIQYNLSIYPRMVIKNTYLPLRLMENEHTSMLLFLGELLLESAIDHISNASFFGRGSGY